VVPLLLKTLEKVGEGKMTDEKIKHDPQKRLMCRDCAKMSGRWEEWKKHRSPYDVATSARCEICHECKGLTIRLRIE
jgi:hypothetical protein